MKFMKRPQEVEAMQIKVALYQADGTRVPEGSWLVEELANDHPSGHQMLLDDLTFRSKYTPVYEMPAASSGVFARISEDYDRKYPSETRKPKDFGQAIVDDEGTRHFLHGGVPYWDRLAARYWWGHKRDGE